MDKKFNVSVEMVGRVSNKTNNTYSVCLITITCPCCNVGLVVEDVFFLFEIFFFLIIMKHFLLHI